jgi:hypothetical protein
MSEDKDEPKPDTARTPPVHAPERPDRETPKEKPAPPHLPPGAMGDWATL